MPLSPVGKCPSLTAAVSSPARVNDDEDDWLCHASRGLADEGKKYVFKCFSCFSGIAGDFKPFNAPQLSQLSCM